MVYCYPGAPPNAWTISGNTTLVPDEEDRKIVPYKIIVALFSVELNGKATGVTHRISRTPPITTKKTYEYRRLLLRIPEEFRVCVSVHAPVNLELTVELLPPDAWTNPSGMRPLSK